MANLELNYCGGSVEAEQSSFYRIPKALLTDERYRCLSLGAKFLYALLMDRTSLSAKNGWTDKDVDEKIWCNDAISTLTNAGLLKGYNDGTFGHNRSITRAEFTAMVNRFFAFSGSGECSFTDIETHWAKADIEQVASLGYIKGRTNAIFAPDALITRAEAAAILNRILERGTEAEFMLEDMKTWPDNPAGTWFYEDIQEATNGHYCETQDEHEVWTELIQD